MFEKIKHDFFIWFMGKMLVFAPSQSHMLFSGENSSRQLCQHIARRGLKKPLIVTDKPLVELGVMDNAISSLAGLGVDAVIYDGVLPNPTYQVVSEGVSQYQAGNCDSIIAIGGGSSIDAAKIIGLSVSNPGHPQDFIGFGKVKQKLPPFFAIPTTSGTGSEATMGAVITNTETHAKDIIAGEPLLPRAACLDPALLTGLPRHITAATGIDALTHAIEAYIGVWDVGDSKPNAAAAVRMVFQDLPTACENGSDIAAREGMAYASYISGQAINVVNVGNVHAIAHQLGAIYGTPHGLANALVLPHVLTMSLDGARQQLEELGRQIGVQSAEAFIDKVRELNARVGIPETLDTLKEVDIPMLVERSVAEGATYPVPHLMSEEEAEQILRKILA